MQKIPHSKETRGYLLPDPGGSPVYIKRVYPTAAN